MLHYHIKPGSSHVSLALSLKTSPKANALYLQPPPTPQIFPLFILLLFLVVIVYLMY